MYDKSEDNERQSFKRDEKNGEIFSIAAGD